mmetsp:Transcript_16769/g.19006  ORF Transcript_16769/g.19006 Transcript_16769/m.19006 type:complete len:361 (+) Transcript_16769:271-1353(+)
MALCESDFECPNKTVCYQNVSWAEDEVFCACDSWFGWVGDDCDELGPQSKMWIVIHLALMFAAIASLAIYGLAGIRQLRSLKGKQQFSSVFQTQTAIYMFLFFRIVCSLLFIINISDVDGFGKVEYDGWDDDFPRKRGSKAIGVIVTQTFSIFWGVLANVNIALVWVQTAYHTKKMLLKGSETMKKFRKIIRALQAIFVIAFVAVLAFSFTAIFVVAIFGSLLLIFLDALAWRWFNEMVRDFSDALEIVVRIKSTLKLLLLCQASLFFSTVILIFMNLGKGDSRDIIEVGKVSSYSILVFWVESSLLASVVVVFRFTVGVQARTSTAGSKKATSKTNLAGAASTTKLAVSEEPMSRSESV